nr:MAG TPA: hypothetical protein [Caudoviricetes sp.]
MAFTFQGTIQALPSEPDTATGLRHPAAMPYI